jgi:hydroxymethylbilane synthase
MQKIIRIGTRESKLALWQANKVRKELTELGYESVLVPIKSAGDIVLDKPLYEMGITGIFTKSLDIALLEGKIDIAVHSLKDVPTALPEGIVQAAVLKRGNYNDVLVLKGTEEFFGEQEGLIATGSLRRRAMWLNRSNT